MVRATTRSTIDCSSRLPLARITVVLKSAPAAPAASTLPAASASTNSFCRWRSRSRWVSVRFSTPHSKPAQASTPITSISSSAFFCVTLVTCRVRFGAMSIRPSTESWAMASRTGVMLTPRRAASSASLIRVPGGSSPVTISLRSCRTTAAVRVGGTAYDIAVAYSP